MTPFAPSAIITWAVSSRRDRRSRILAHTADILARTSDCEHLSKADLKVHELLSERRQLSLSDDDESLQQAARLMLNYYEFVCEMSGKGILDKNTVDHLRGGLIARTYRACEDFIEAYRREQGRDEAFTMMKEFTQTREKRERASDS